MLVGASQVLYRIGTGIEAGVTVSKFQLADDIFDNGTRREKNWCYQNNLPSGLQVGGLKKAGTTSLFSERDPVQDARTSLPLTTPLLQGGPFLQKVGPSYEV